MTLEEKKIKEVFDKYSHKDNGGEYMYYSHFLKAVTSICQQEIDAKRISVKDRLPEQSKAVLIKTSYGKCDVCNLWIDRENNIIWVNDMRPQHSDGDVTHWMPLPESPKESEK